MGPRQGLRSSCPVSGDPVEVTTMCDGFADAVSLHMTPGIMVVSSQALLRAGDRIQLQNGRVGRM